MIEVRKILCPTDFSEFSDHALQLSLTLARWYRSTLCVMHAVPQVLMHPEYFPYMQEPVLPASNIRKQALEELHRFVEKARTSGVSTEARLEEGDSAEKILESASKLPADMVVMGTHGRRGFERLVLGSVAEKVLRKALCPVLTVPKARETADSTGEARFFETILCPIDFSVSSIKALEYALSLAREARSQLVLLHVVESLFEDLPLRGPQSVREIRDHLQREALQKLNEAVPVEVRDSCRPEFLVVSGRAYQQILRLAEDKRADLIVIGVQGRSAIDLMLFGSTTHHVVGQAPCPVLTIRTE